MNDVEGYLYRYLQAYGFPMTIEEIGGALKAGGWPPSISHEVLNNLVERGLAQIEYTFDETTYTVAIPRRE